MMQRRVMLAAFAVLAVCAQQPAAAQNEAAPAGPVTAAASESARDVLARVRSSVVQIEGFFGSNTARAFHGTGFAVADGGLFATNYHVVAEHVQRPEKYRLEYRTTDGKTGKLAVMAVDVLHDLALVRAETHAPNPLALAEGAPVKGERAYSVGFPLDVGLTITEGVSNGKVEDAFDARIHYSGALNAGMSGGPAFNAAGEVIGVNVSGYFFQQLVSFLVPAEHVRALRDRVPAEAPENALIKKDVLAQMHAHSAQLLGALDGPIPTQVTAGYALPAKLAHFIECNATGNTLPNQPVETVRITCDAKAGLHLQQGLNIGDLKYLHIVLSTDKLGAWRFANRLSGISSMEGWFGSRQHVGPLACEDRTVALDGFDASVAVCVRGYRKFAGLYDFTVRVLSLNGTRQGFVSHLDMSGLEYEAGMKFVRRYVEVLAWKP